MQSTRQLSPARILMILTVSIFVSEMLVMVIISFLPPLSPGRETLFDSIVLVVLLFPILYFLVFRPLLLHITERKQAEEQLHKLSRAVEESPSIVMITDSQGLIEYVNPKFTEITGYTFDEIRGANAADLGEQKHEEAKELWEMLSTGREWRGEFPNKKKSGERYWELASISSIKNQAGLITHFIKVAEDITERKQAEESLRKSEERFRVTFEQAAVGMALSTPDGHWLRVNQKLCDIVGYTREELMEKASQEITHPNDLETNLRHTRQALAGEIQTFSLEKRYVRKDNSLIWVNLTASLVREPSGTPKYFIVVVEDITRRKRAEEQLQHDAFHDTLTGLPNRVLFIDRLAHSLGHAKRHRDYLCAVIFLDLDRFRIISENLGPIIADQLLMAIAYRLKICVRSGDTVAHLSGDEFAILLDDIKDAAEAAHLADQLQEIVSFPLNLNTHSEDKQEMGITASIGIVLSRDTSTGRLYDQPEDVLRDAGIARYRAKARGWARVEMFEIGMRAQAVATLELEAGLHRAIEQEEFRIHYQPIVSISGGQITGVEALLRWQHPQRGLVYPGEFVPLLEETGLIVSISEWVLRTACTQVKAWHAAGYESLRVAVNISVRQFQEYNLPELVKKILAETGLAASSLELEVTESIAMPNVDFSLLLLDELSRMGLHISIDDFGTGYSSLDRLKRLPVNALKIDQSFIRGLTSDLNDTAITTATIAMAHNLQLKVIAEGVETETQLAFLRLQQCDEGQGYLFSRPIAAKEITKLLQAESMLQK